MKISVRPPALNCDVLRRSPDLEQLYQQFSFAQRRTSLVVTNVIDILARLLVLLLAWPSGWWGVVCNWLAGLSVVMWAAICVLALTRKEVMRSPQWLRCKNQKGSSNVLFCSVP